MALTQCERWRSLTVSIRQQCPYNLKANKVKVKLIIPVWSFSVGNPYIVNCYLNHEFYLCTQWTTVFLFIHLYSARCNYVRYYCFAHFEDTVFVQIAWSCINLIWSICTYSSGSFVQHLLLSNFFLEMFN